jgi:hypothetical protein
MHEARRVGSTHGNAARCQREPAAQAFVPIKLEPTLKPNLPAIKAASLAGKAAPTLVRMQVRLPNGVSIDLGQAPIQELGDVMQMLSALPCSN